MARPLLIFLISIFPILLFSQNNDELRDVLDLPKNACEEYSGLYSNQISELDFDDIDSIGMYLDFWIEKCGYNEAVFRVFILISIQEGTIDEKDLGENYKYFLANFQERILESQRSDYQEVFENDKAFFLYIPLRSNFDSWTAEWARGILKNKNPKGLDHYLLTLYSQKHQYFLQEELNNSLYDSISFVKEWRADIIEERRNEGGFAVMLGTWIPLGEVSNYLDISPIIGINGEVPVSDRTYLGGNLNIKIPINKKEFRITTIDSTALTKATFSFDMDLYLAYNLIETKNMRFNTFGGLGFEISLTDIERPPENEEEESSNYSINSYLINLGFELSFRDSKYSYWGIRTTYTLMDYNLGIRVADNLSGNALRAMIFYRF